MVVGWREVLQTRDAILGRDDLLWLPPDTAAAPSGHLQQGVHKCAIVILFTDNSSKFLNKIYCYSDRTTLISGLRVDKVGIDILRVL